ncbi:MAG: hypothetical protein E6J09_07115 [Chloroflexi bacterium]|nr:MAG: hypothetical protein E6J09_07115 [Chloroflexota bacterium]
MRRVWNFFVDLIDGVFAAMLYGNHSRTVTSYGIEAQNQDRLREWAAGSGKRDDANAEEAPADDFDERMRRFRRGTSEPRDLS